MLVAFDKYVYGYKYTHRGKEVSHIVNKFFVALLSDRLVNELFQNKGLKGSRGYSGKR